MISAFVQATDFSEHLQPVDPHIQSNILLDLINKAQQTVSQCICYVSQTGLHNHDRKGGAQQMTIKNLFI